MEMGLDFSIRGPNTNNVPLVEPSLCLYIKQQNLKEKIETWVLHLGVYLACTDATQLACVPIHWAEAEIYDAV